MPGAGERAIIYGTLSRIIWLRQAVDQTPWKAEGPITDAFLPRVRYTGGDGRAASEAASRARGSARETAVTGLENVLYGMISSWYLTVGYFGIVLATPHEE